SHPRCGKPRWGLISRPRRTRNCGTQSPPQCPVDTIESTMHVELVSVTTSDAVRLEGSLREPAEGSAHGELGLDLVVCHHGVGSNFYVPNFFDRMGDQLVARGCAILRANSRGHDQSFYDGPRALGSAYEIVDDCRQDIIAWLDF